MPETENRSFWEFWPLAARDPSLVRVLPDVLNFSLDVWRAVHAGMRDSVPVRLLAGHLDREFKAYLGGTEAPPDTASEGQ